jgi:phosphinothricin acetyltransferase
MDGAPTVVRPATRDDLNAVAAIFAHYVTTSVVTFEQTPPSVAHWQDLHTDLAGRSLPFLVCAVGDAPIGYAYATPWRTKPAYGRTVEDSIYLTPDHTGRGLGHRLLHALLTGCAAVGVEQVIAVIADGGDPTSTALHRAHGFTDAGRLRRVGYKHGRHLDTVLLQRDLRDLAAGMARAGNGP